MKIQATHSPVALLAPPSLKAEPAPTGTDPQLSAYLRSATSDAQAVKGDGLSALSEDMIPMGESRFDSSLTADFLGLADEWPWTITRTPNEIRMFCPGGYNAEKGKNEDKQIILTADPSNPGKATLRMMIDGDWRPSVQGRLVAQNGGAVFQGAEGEMVSLKANRKGFRLDVEGCDKICPELDGHGVQMDRKS